MSRTALHKVVLVVVALLSLAVQPFRSAPASAQAVTAPINWSFSHSGPMPIGWSRAQTPWCNAASNVWVADGVLTERVGPVGSTQYCGEIGRASCRASV